VTKEIANLRESMEALSL
jgi:hypothetical protein